MAMFAFQSVGTLERGYYLCMFFFLFRFGPGKGQIWLNEVMCNGTEYFIQDCQNLGWGEAHCTHAEDAGVVCQRKCISICLCLC